MTQIDGPRLLRPDEYNEMMRMLDRYFGYERGGMAERLPHCYDPNTVEDHAIIKVDGEIVSHVGAIPETLAIGEGETIDCRGIAGVATDKRHRGNGYMSQLLRFWLDQMESEGVPLAELGGNRQRYNHFGWESAGREHHYVLDERSFDAAEGDRTIARYEGSTEQVEFLRDIHGDEPYRVKRDRDLSRSIYGQRGLEFLLYEGDGDDAYLALTRESRERNVVEFGGSASGIESLLAHVFAAYDVNNLTVIVPPRHPRNRIFREHSRSWTVHPHRMVNIRDLETVLTQFTPQIASRLRRRGGAEEGVVTLGIQSENDSVALTYGPGGVDAQPYDGTPDVTLDRLTMTGLLFGSHDRGRKMKTKHPVFEALFPLEFFIWRSEWV